MKELSFDFWANENDNRDTDPNNRVWRTAHKAANQMEIMELNWATVNSWTIAAACIYMVSHLQIRPKTFKKVSLMSSVPFASIRNTYDVTYHF